MSAPTGWNREQNDKGRIVYTSPPPRVKIYCVKKLQEFQEAGRFLDVDAASFNFRKSAQVSSSEPRADIEPSGQESSPAKSQDESSLSPSNKECPIQAEPHNEEYRSEDEPQNKISTSEPPKKIMKIKHQKNLTDLALDQLSKKASEESVNHQKVLTECCKDLQSARLNQSSSIQDLNLAQLKSEIVSCKSEANILAVLESNAGLRNYFTNLDQNRCLEQMVTLGRSSNYNPLRAFPPSVNSNIYRDIVIFGLENVPDLIKMLLDFVVDKDKMITPDSVIKVASLFSQVAHAVSRKNDALIKTKTLGLKDGGLSHESLDAFNVTGMSTTSRCFNQQKDFMAAISDHFLDKTAASSSYQTTMDNLDIRINGVDNHLMLAFLEFEQIDTKHLDTRGANFDNMMEAFNLENIQLTSPRNKERLEHYKLVVVITLGRFLADNIPEVSWMKGVLPNHYSHPNSNSTKKAAILYTKKPLYLCEQVNSEMIQLCESEQSSFLQLVGASLPDGEKLGYFQDLHSIQDTECDTEVREAAEARIHEAVLAAGEYIGHGDLLTMERFYVAKRLRQGSVTAFERLEYLRYFRIELFHLKMNKVIQDYENGMKNEVNVDDAISLAYIKAITGMKNITKDPKVIKQPGRFEEHDQFISGHGKQLLIEGFRHFLLHNPEFPQNKDLDSAKHVVLKFLDEYDIKYFFDNENTEEREPYDDLLTYSKNVSSRTLHSLVMDKLEEEADALGLEAFRRTMISYTLSRKENIQDSKYASWLLFDLVMELSASPRTKARMDDLVCCNPSGHPGAAIFRDKRNEHEVRSVKTALRGIHGSLKDVGVEKTICGLNVASKITEHDMNSMLLPKKDNSSYDYLGDEKRDIITKEIRKANIFSKTREKISFYDRTTSSVYTNMTSVKLERFVARNKKNFKRNYTDRKI